jgi:hypothetical protein
MWLDQAAFDSFGVVTDANNRPRLWPQANQILIKFANIGSRDRDPNDPDSQTYIDKPAPYANAFPYDANVVSFVDFLQYVRVKWSIMASTEINKNVYRYPEHLLGDGGYLIETFEIENDPLIFDWEQEVPSYYYENVNNLHMNGVAITNRDDVNGYGVNYIVDYIKAGRLQLPTTAINPKNFAKSTSKQSLKIDRSPIDFHYPMHKGICFYHRVINPPNGDNSAFGFTYDWYGDAWSSRCGDRGVGIIITKGVGTFRRNTEFIMYDSGESALDINEYMDGDYIDYGQNAERYRFPGAYYPFSQWGRPEHLATGDKYDDNVLTETRNFVFEYLTELSLGDDDFIDNVETHKRRAHEKRWEKLLMSTFLCSFAVGRQKYVVLSFDVVLYNKVLTWGQTMNFASILIDENVMDRVHAASMMAILTLDCMRNPRVVYKPLIFSDPLGKTGYIDYRALYNSVMARPQDVDFRMANQQYEYTVEELLQTLPGWDEMDESLQDHIREGVEEGLDPAYMLALYITLHYNTDIRGNVLEDAYGRIPTEHFTYDNHLFATKNDVFNYNPTEDSVEFWNDMAAKWLERYFSIK